MATRTQRRTLQGVSVPHRCAVQMVRPQNISKAAAGNSKMCRMHIFSDSAC